MNPEQVRSGQEQMKQEILRKGLEVSDWEKFGRGVLSEEFRDFKSEIIPSLKGMPENDPCIIIFTTNFRGGGLAEILYSSPTTRFTDEEEEEEFQQVLNSLNEKNMLYNYLALADETSITIKNPENGNFIKVDSSPQADKVISCAKDSEASRIVEQWNKNQRMSVLNARRMLEYFEIAGSFSLRQEASVKLPSVIW